MQLSPTPETASIDVIIVGAGPAGLMAARVISDAGYRVEIHDQMPSFGRKFLMAGKSGLNLTKALPRETFLERYFKLPDQMARAVKRFGPAEVTAWCEVHGIATFTGSSGRVFPKMMKASPLLRAWLSELSARNVSFNARSRWLGFTDAGLLFEGPGGVIEKTPTVSVLAFGGGSWRRLGSDATWVEPLRELGILINPFVPTNCGFACVWPEHFIEKNAGQPIKTVLAAHSKQSVKGDFVATQNGVEGGVIYELSHALRETIHSEGKAILEIDLAPDRARATLEAALSEPRKKQSFANHLRRKTGLRDSKAALLRSSIPPEKRDDPVFIARQIKSLPVILTETAPLDEAISTGGGIDASAYDDDFMLKARAGTFVAGEMLDWDAPTGGFLLTACLASGKAAGEGVVRYLENGRTFA